MIYSKSCEYALRALTYLAMLGDERLATVREISQREALPRQFLAKLLQQMARAGIVASVKGPGGGFALAQPPGQITLFGVVTCVDGPIDFDRCAVGLMDCSDATPCPLHDEWKPLRDAIERYLLRTNLHMLRAALEQKLAQSTDAGGVGPACGWSANAASGRQRGCRECV